MVGVLSIRYYQFIIFGYFGMFYYYIILYYIILFFIYKINIIKANTLKIKILKILKVLLHQLFIFDEIRS